MSRSWWQQLLQQRTGRIGMLQSEQVVEQEQAVRQVEQAVGQVDRLAVVGDQLVVVL